MRSIIAAALISSATFAQVPSPEQCAQFSRDCFAQVCEVNSQQPIPTTVRELEAALSRTNFQLPQNVSRELDVFANKLATLNRSNQNLFRTRGAAAIASDILQKPVLNSEGLMHLLGERLRLTRVGGQFQVVLNDLDPERALNQRMGTLLSEVMNTKLGLAHPQERMREPGALNFYRDLFFKMEQSFASDPARVQRLQTARVQMTGANLATFAMNLSSFFTNDEVDRMLAPRVASHSADLTRILTLDAEANATRTTKGTDPRRIKDSITKSCQLASFMLERTRGTNPQARFEEAKSDALRGLEASILPKLSSHTRSFITAELAKNPFRPVDFNRNIYPDLRSFSARVDALPAGYLSQFELFKDSSKFACAFDTFIPEDFFDGEAITTSLFSIALGYDDVLAHELGHWFSDKMGSPGVSGDSRRNFEVLRSCIGGFYQNGGRSIMPTAFRRDTLYTEEDFSDWFAAQVSPKLSKAFCSFDQMAPMFMTYLTGNVQPGHDVYAPNPQDNHSSALFRILHQKMVRGESLPVSCQNLLNASPGSRPVRCDL